MKAHKVERSKRERQVTLRNRLIDAVKLCSRWWLGRPLADIVAAGTLSRLVAGLSFCLLLTSLHQPLRAQETCPASVPPYSDRTFGQAQDGSGIWITKAIGGYINGTTFGPSHVTPVAQDIANNVVDATAFVKVTIGRMTDDDVVPPGFKGAIILTVNGKDQKAVPFNASDLYTVQPPCIPIST